MRPNESFGLKRAFEVPDGRWLRERTRLQWLSELRALFLFQSMESRREVAQLWTIGLCTLLGVVCGCMTAAVICYLQPKIYRSRAVIMTAEKQVGEMPLSRLRAAQICRLLELEEKLGEPESEIVEKLCRRVRIKAVSAGAEITAESTNKFDARDISLEAARLFRGMKEESSLALKSEGLQSMGELERGWLSKRKAVEDLMRDESMEVGLGPYFDGVWPLALKGQPGAKTLWESESFQLHWKFHEEATRQLTHEAESARFPVIELPQLADRPSSPNVELHLQLGLLAGTLVGVLVGVRRSRHAPLVHTDSKSSDEPAPSPRGSDATVVSPEDEW
jgi:hypothetical protein